MSRVGRKPIPLPDGVSVEVTGQRVTVKGPGNKTLSQEVRPTIGVKVEDGQVLVTRANDAKQNRALHGLYRQLIENMVIGVTAGFQKTLEIVGVGWRAQMQGGKLVLQVGFCHPVELEVPDGLEVGCPKPTVIVVKGADKQQVGQFAATTRAVRKPEPYKGKGIRYRGEHVRRLPGKSFAGGAA